MVDIHTHRNPSLEEAIYPVTPDPLFSPQPDQWYSVGIHPWKVQDFLQGKMGTKEALEEYVRSSRVLAVGEAGLDKVHFPAAMEPGTQKLLYKGSVEVFKWQARLAEEVQKPLIIHCVRAMDDLLALKKELSPVQLWIIHGFRGKPRQGIQLMDHGFALSFGEYFHPETVRLVPEDLLFAETDESTLPISEIIRKLGNARNQDKQELQSILERNVSRHFKTE